MLEVHVCSFWPKMHDFGPFFCYPRLSADQYTLNYSDVLRPKNTQKFRKGDFDFGLTLSLFASRSAHWVRHHNQKKNKWGWVSAMNPVGWRGWGLAFVMHMLNNCVNPPLIFHIRRPLVVTQVHPSLLVRSCLASRLEPWLVCQILKSSCGRFFILGLLIESRV